MLRTQLLAESAEMVNLRQKNKYLIEEREKLRVEVPDFSVDAEACIAMQTKLVSAAEPASSRVSRGASCTLRGERDEINGKCKELLIQVDSISGLAEEDRDIRKKNAKSAVDKQRLSH